MGKYTFQDQSLKIQFKSAERRKTWTGTGGVIKTSKSVKLRQWIKESIKTRKRAGDTITWYTHLGFPSPETPEDKGGTVDLRDPDRSIDQLIK